MEPSSPGLPPRCAVDTDASSQGQGKGGPAGRELTLLEGWVPPESASPHQRKTSLNRVYEPPWDRSGSGGPWAHRVLPARLRPPCSSDITCFPSGAHPQAALK